MYQIGLDAVVAKKKMKIILNKNKNIYTFHVPTLNILKTFLILN